MNPPSMEIIKTWILSIKRGEVTKLLSEESAVQELHNGCDEIIALKAFSLLASKIFELKTKSLSTVFPGATPLHLFNLSDLFSSLYVKNKASNIKYESYIISLHHVMSYFLKEECYESSLKLKRYIEEIGYGAHSVIDTKQRTMIFHNLYLMFWNSSIDLEKKSGDLELVLNLRLAAIDLLTYADPCKLPTVSERIIVTSRIYVANRKDNILSESISKMCNDILGIATSIVNSFLKLNHISESKEISCEMTDRLFVSVKSYGEVLTEVMRVHNLFSRGREGLEMCTKYCKMCCGSEHLGKIFKGFLDILCDIFSQVAVVTDGDVILRKDFNAIYHKLCEIQNLSDCDTQMKSEQVYCGVKFKSPSFLKASECVCRAIIDLWTSQNTEDSLGICAKNRSGLLLLLELGGKLNMSSDVSYSLKFMAYSLKVVVHMLSSDSEDTNFGEYDHQVVKAKEILIFCMSVEEKVNSFQSNNSKAAVNVMFQVLPVAIQLFFKKKLLITCEEFLIKYHKLISKWVVCHEFSVLKDSQWWAIKNLCICRRDQKKFRAALSALAMAVEGKITGKYSSVFNEWAKVKISAQLSDEAGDLKLSTVYHILKENTRDQNWHFSKKDISQLLKLEMYAYMSKETCMNDALQEVCHTILEISGNLTVKAEAQLCLIELSCTKGSPDSVFEEGEMDPGDGTMKANVMADSDWKTALNSCKKLAADFQKDIRNAPVAEDLPAMLCVLGKAYYLMFLCKSCLDRKKAKDEISGNGAIQLQVPRKVDVNGQEEMIDDTSSCDIVPSQLSLKSSKQRHLLNSTLNVAIALWEHADEKGMKNAAREQFNVTAILKCIETAAFIYELYDDLWHSTKAWCLLCKYGDTFMEDETYVIGLSNLMRKGAVSLTGPCLLRVDSITSKLDKKSPVLLSYLLGKCWQYLYTSEFSSGLPILGGVLKDCNPTMSKWHSVLSAQAKYLSALYCLQSPVNIVNPELSKDPVFWSYTRYDSAISALSTLIRLLGGWKDSGSLSLYYFGLTFLLDISLWLGEVFLELNIPRDAYAYLKQQFLLAQKFLLPNRTVQFLTTLAFVDMMDCNQRDCEVKLLGMESIIDLDHEKDNNELVRDIQNLIQWLDKRKEATNKIDQRRFEGVLFSEDNDEVRVETKVKKEVGCYSPGRPGSNYKFAQMKKCTDTCVCEWCINSGFQKAFSALRVVQVCLAYKSQLENLSPSTDIFENSNRILRGIVSRFKVMTSKMSKLYFSLLPSEVGETIGAKLHQSDFFVAEIGKLHAFYVRFILNMAECYSIEWENSDTPRSDFLKKSETLISVLEEETKDMKYLYVLQFFGHHLGKQKLIMGKARMMSPSNQDESCNKYEEEFRHWAKEQGQAEVCKTPTKEINNTPHPRKVKNADGDGGADGIYDPIPSVPKRNLPRQNLNFNFKEEDLFQCSKAKKVPAPFKIKKGTNNDSKTSKLKEGIAGGIKMREVLKSNPKSGVVKKDSATSSNEKGAAKNDVNDKVGSDIRARRRPNKK